MSCARHPLRNNLPPPFTQAIALLASHTGSIAIVDVYEDIIAHVSLATAYALAADSNDPPAIRCSYEHRGSGQGASGYGLSLSTGAGQSVKQTH